MPLPVGGRIEDLEKLYQNGLFGDQDDPKRPPIPVGVSKTQPHAARVLASAAGEWARETGTRAACGYGEAI